MPKSDGSGPLRLRLRGRGMRFVRTAGATTRRPIGRGILGIGVPLVAALIRDMKQPDGYLRPFLNRIMHRKPTIRLIDVHQSSIEDKTKKIETQKDTSNSLIKGK